MDWTKHSLIGGNTRRIEIIKKHRYIQWNRGQMHGHDQTEWYRVDQVSQS